MRSRRLSRRRSDGRDGDGRGIRVRCELAETKALVTSSNPALTFDNGGLITFPTIARAGRARFAPRALRRRLGHQAAGRPRHRDKSLFLNPARTRSTRRSGATPTKRPRVWTRWRCACRTGPSRRVVPGHRCGPGVGVTSVSPLNHSFFVPDRDELQEQLRPPPITVGSGAHGDVPPRLPVRADPLGYDDAGRRDQPGRRHDVDRRRRVHDAGPYPGTISATGTTRCRAGRRSSARALHTRRSRPRRFAFEPPTRASRCAFASGSPRTAPSAAWAGSWTTSPSRVSRTSRSGRWSRTALRARARGGWRRAGGNLVRHRGSEPAR